MPSCREQSHEALANKFMRTFTAQIDALSRLRRGGEQIVKHVYVGEGGQAVFAKKFITGGGLIMKPADKAMEPQSLRLAPRCLARTRRGTECQSPAMPNGRCRLHGGLSTGAPMGNRNACKHGLRSGEHQAMRAALKMMRADLAGFSD